MRNAYRYLVRKPDRKRPLGRFWDRREGDIRMVSVEIRWEGVEWMHLAEDRDQWQAAVNMVMKLQVP
jgi:hypothetical protein